MKTQREIIDFLNRRCEINRGYSWTLKKFLYEPRVEVVIERSDDEKFISWVFMTPFFRRGFTFVEAGVNKYNAPRLVLHYTYGTPKPETVEGVAL